MATFTSGDIVTVPDDEGPYFDPATRWRVGTIWNTNTEGFMASLTALDDPANRRNVLVSRLRRVELPPALR